LDFRGRFGAFVSALQNRVSARQRLVLVETWFEMLEPSQQLHGQNRAQMSGSFTVFVDQRCVSAWATFGIESNDLRFWSSRFQSHSVMSS